METTINPFVIELVGKLQWYFVKLGFEYTLNFLNAQPLLPPRWEICLTVYGAGNIYQIHEKGDDLLEVMLAAYVAGLEKIKKEKANE